MRPWRFVWFLGFTVFVIMIGTAWADDHATTLVSGSAQVPGLGGATVGDITGPGALVIFAALMRGWTPALTIRVDLSETTLKAFHRLTAALDNNEKTSAKDEDDSE